MGALSKLALSLALVALASTASAATSQPIDAKTQKKLDQNWELCQVKKKGPFTANTCLCRDGTTDIVRKVDGKLISPCGGAFRWCEAFRSDWGQALADEGMYVANLFQRDLHLWDSFPDHHDLVRGYLLEKFFIENNPDHKLATLRAYGGLAGSEYEAKAAPEFFERYLALDDFNEPRHYLLAYELQRRFFVRNDQGQIQKVRTLATAIQGKRREFKPLRDQVHNQISAALIPKLEAYRDAQPKGKIRDQTQELISEIEKLTSLDQSALRAQLPELENADVRKKISDALPDEGADPVSAIGALADVTVLARTTVEAKEVTPADRRRLIDLAITAGAVIQAMSVELVGADQPMSVQQHLELLQGLTNAAYGAGLLMERERAAAQANLAALLKDQEPQRAEFQAGLRRAARVAEWAQLTTLYAIEEVRAPWGYLLPQTNLFPDDVLRSSPLLLYAQVLQDLEDYASGQDPIRHDIFGAEVDAGVRVLNAGLSQGVLRVNPAAGEYARNQVVALQETPADLEPAAGIFTVGEGNVVSHVQLLARSLGIPNVVLGPSVFERLKAHDSKPIFFIATPQGRLILKEASAMTDQDRAIVAEYTRDEERDDGALGGGAGKLKIDKERLDLTVTTALDLGSVRRKDSGTRCGPKAAFLGELQHHFGDRVGRGVVVPFGAYYEHFQRAKVAVPKELAKQKLAEPGKPLPAFVESTYKTFFDDMIARGASEEELTTWIRPRLQIMRHSIEQTPMSPELMESVRSQLRDRGLLKEGNPAQTVGLFVRSDTNVEDLDEFNGAGLNLTLFNLQSVDDVFAGVQQVWSSPFTYRSFSWRQTLIDEPMWVLPSVVILESIPNEKSGVLVTADVETGDTDKMLIATSEGVGGAVDGSPAETLVWSKDGVELVTMFKSPYRRLLSKEGGSSIVPSTRGEYVLSEEEIESLVSAAQKIGDKFEPSRDSEGQPRPWDVEYGFTGGELFLFQTRPFVGNDQLSNVQALAAYEVERAQSSANLSLKEQI